jgi:hypothetical protein
LRRVTRLGLGSETETALINPQHRSKSGVPGPEEPGGG